MLAHLLGLPKQSEILIIIFLGICFLSLDFSLFEIRSNLDKIWKLELNKAKHLETALKYVTSAVVLARTFTLHAFLACYVVMLWPAIFEEKANLMLPWLFLGILRSLILNGVTFSVGTFICHEEKGLGPICLEYILAQVIEHGPSIYAWVSVLSFYRDLVGEHDPNQSSQESLLSGTEEPVESEGNEDMKNDNYLDKSKSYSLSDLNLDYMHSSRFRTLSADMPMDVLIEELSHLVSKTRIIQDSSKSFNSIHQDKSDSIEVFDSLSKKDLSIIEKTMKILELSEEDVAKAQQDKFKLIKILRDVNIEDVNKMDEKPLQNMTSPSFYIRKGRVRKGIKTQLPKSLSLHEDGKSRDSCLCYLRRELQKDQSKLSLVETEIANIQFDESDKDGDRINEGENSRMESETRPSYKENPIPRTCQAKFELKRGCVGNKSNLDDFAKNFMKNDIPRDLNRFRVVVGASLGLNATNFLEKFAMKKNTSKNFGCQVSLLKQNFLIGSRNELTKNLTFLRNLKLL